MVLGALGSTLLATMVSGDLDCGPCSCGLVRMDLLVMKLTARERMVIERLKASRVRGAASISLGQFAEVVDDLLEKKLIEKYGFGYRITEKGMKA